MGAFFCLLYTSDAADEEDSVDLGGRRIIKKKEWKRKSNKLQTSNRSDRRGGEISLECRGMNEKGTHRVLGLARDYFSDS